MPNPGLGPERHGDEQKKFFLLEPIFNFDSVKVPISVSSFN